MHGPLGMEFVNYLIECHDILSRFNSKSNMRIDLIVPEILYLIFFLPWGTSKKLGKLQHVKSIQ